MQLKVLIVSAILAAAVGSPTPEAADAASAHAIDTAHSTLILHVWKTGLFAFAADNHIINAPIESGSVNEGKKSVDLTVDARELKVLDPKMPADRRAQVQGNMESAQVLDATRFPKIEYKSTSLDFDAKGDAKIAGELTLHGQTHPVTARVRRTSAGHYHGTAVVRQTEFGITPIRIAGGTVKVKDNVDVEFDIVTR
jgi:polyisoprenoid-binding protein YceI